MILMQLVKLWLIGRRVKIKDNPPGKDDPSSTCVGGAGAVFAQSSEPHTSSPYYAPLDSDDENDAFQQDMGVV